MQKLTVHTDPNSTARRISKYNLGQTVYVIQWREGKPFVIRGVILYIGIVHALQSHDFLYMIDRDYKDEEFKRYYEKDVYPTMLRAIKALKVLMRKNLSDLKEMANHPYYLNGDE